MRETRLGRRGPRGARTAALALLFVTLVAARGDTQEKLTAHTYTRSAATPAPSAQLQDMAWLAGHWVGEALGGTVEEIWSPPRGGAMMGMFRLVKDGETAFYELMTILPEDGSLLLRLKHFNANLGGWEEKDDTVEFPLVAIADGAFRFEGLSLHPEGDDRLKIHLAMHKKDGTMQEVTFAYTRVSERLATPGSGR